MKALYTKIVLLSILSFVCINVSKAQDEDEEDPEEEVAPATNARRIGFQFSYIKPAGDLKYFFKPTVGIELFYRFCDPVDDRLQLSVALGYYRQKATMDSFPVYSISGSTLHPGREVWSEYYVVPVGVNSEYNLLDASLSPIVGLDCYFYLASYTHYSDAVAYRSVYESGATSVTIAVVPKVGMLYQTGMWMLGAGVGKSYGYTFKADGNHRYWKPYFNATYFF